MAEVLARSLFAGSLYTASAGVRPGERDAFVDAVLGEIGLGLGTHRPHRLEDLEDLNFDLAVTLSPEAHHLMMEMTRTLAIDVEYWPTPDPTLGDGTRDQILAAYRNVRVRLGDQITKRFGPASNESVFTRDRIG
jgi:protein-tyrosine-phosphatase